MAKTKTPFLSLGSSGTIGGFLTSQKRGGDTILREKPIPTDPYSLKQAYQRWDYRDYAYLWTLLSNSDKQIYRTRASRYHITGFSQFMRENLKALTDIAGRWHLDELGGAVAYDSSRNGNDGAIIGASPATGLIAGAYSFDGLNDTINCGNSPTLNPGTESFTMECFIKTTDTDLYSYIMSKRLIPFQYVLRLTNGRPTLYLQSGAGALTISLPNSIADNLWHHLVAVFDRSTDLASIHVDGTWKGSGDISAHPNFDNTGDFYIACREGVGYFLNATLDNCTLYTYALNLTEIKRHSERRYPL